MVPVPGAGPGPDQQDGAGRVVDDEPAGRSQALGAETGTVAVPGEDEPAGVPGGGDDLPLDPPGSLQPGAAFGRGLQELAGGGRPQVLQPGAGSRPGWPRPPVATR